MAATREITVTSWRELSSALSVAGADTHDPVGKITLSEVVPGMVRLHVEVDMIPRGATEPPRDESWNEIADEDIPF